MHIGNCLNRVCLWYVYHSSAAYPVIANYILPQIHIDYQSYYTRVFPYIMHCVAVYNLCKLVCLADTHWITIIEVKFSEWLLLRTLLHCASWWTDWIQWSEQRYVQRTLKQWTYSVLFLGRHSSRYSNERHFMNHFS